MMFFHGNGRFDFEIVGESHYQANLASCVGPREPDGYDHDITAALSHDNDNKFDPSAVAVFLLPTIPGKGILVGYLDRKSAKKFRAEVKRLGAGERDLTLCRAKIVGGWDDGKGDRGYIGVKLDLIFPLKCKANWADVPLTRVDRS